MTKSKKIGLAIVATGLTIGVSIFTYKQLAKPNVFEALKQISTLINEKKYTEAEQLLNKFDIKNDPNIAMRERIEFLAYKSKIEVVAFVASPMAHDISGLSTIKKLHDQIRFTKAFLRSQLTPKSLILTTLVTESEDELSHAEMALQGVSFQQLQQNNQMLFNQQIPVKK